MSDFSTRLKKFIEIKGYTISSFEKECNLGNATINKALKNKTGLRTDIIDKILTKFPDLSLEWLFKGTSNSDDLDAIRPNSKFSKAGGIPLIPVEAMAGFFSGEVSVREEDCERINIPGLKADYVIQISGDSMEPKYYSGDFVACQRIEGVDAFFQWGKVYVIDTAQGVLIKKVKRSSKDGYITLCSENPEYDPVEIHCSEIYNIALVKALVRIV